MLASRAQYTIRIKPSSNATITINSIVGTCPNMIVSATISNTGSYLLPAGTYVALYDANPTAGVANLIGTYQTTATIAAGGSMTVTMTANLVGASSVIYTVVNDRGTNARPFNLNTWTTNTGLSECSYTNNIDSKTFHNLPNLYIIHLENNQIKNIDPKTFQNVPNLYLIHLGIKIFIL